MNLIHSPSRRYFASIKKPQSVSPNQLCSRRTMLIEFQNHFCYVICLGKTPSIAELLETPHTIFKLKTVRPVVTHFIGFYHAYQSGQRLETRAVRVCLVSCDNFTSLRYQAYCEVSSQVTRAATLLHRHTLLRQIPVKELWSRVVQGSKQFIALSPTGVCQKSHSENIRQTRLYW